jgi:flagellar motor switch protein FliG
MSIRRLCKHIAKLLLSIDKQKATEVLRSLYEKEESWQLRIYPK